MVPPPPAAATASKEALKEALKEESKGEEDEVVVVPKVDNDGADQATSHGANMSPILVCTLCGTGGSDPACSGGAGFHVFAGWAPPEPASASAATATPGSTESKTSTDLGSTDMPTHVINLDAPPHERWSHILPQYEDAARALQAKVHREMEKRAPEFAAATVELAAALPKRFDFAAELDGIADLLGVDRTMLMTQQLWLETYGGCSTVIMNTDAAHVGGTAGEGENVIFLYFCTLFALFAHTHSHSSQFYSDPFFVLLIVLLIVLLSRTVHHPHDGLGS